MKFKLPLILNINLASLPNCIKGNAFRISLSNDSSQFFECPELFACIISKKASKLKDADPTIERFTISHQTTLKYLNQIYQELNNSDNRNIEVNFTSIQDLENFMKDIECQILTISIKEEDITITNSVDLLHQISIFNDTDSFYQKVVDFISQNFDDIENKEDLSVDELELILSNQLFQIHSESTLFNFIVNYIKERKNPDSLNLFGYIEFQNLPVSDIETFLQMITIDDLNGFIFEKVKKRLLLNFSPSIENDSRYIIEKFQNFPCIQNEKFKGIINGLNQKCGGNCSVEGVISVTCSKIQGSQKATDLTDYSNTKIHYSWIDNQLNGYFEFDFKEQKVVISKYELQTPDSGANNSYPKNWSIECSDDKKEWFVIDKVTNDENLHGPMKHHVFDVKNPISQPCRYVRIYQRGGSHNASNDNYFGLYFTEFYGQLYK